MGMEFTEKRLAASILVLASLPPASRAAETATATKVLAELHARAAAVAEKGYANAVLDAVDALGDDVQPEPWLAFISAGPGRPPPAVELLRPPPAEPDAGWWSVIKAWTSPGQMYALLFAGEMPPNELNALTKTVTLGVAEAAVAGVGAAAEAVGGAWSFIKLLFAGLVVGGGYYLHKKKRA